jgi:hypothetical protein
LPEPNLEPEPSQPPVAEPLYPAEPEPQECIHCGRLIGPDYIEAHMAGRDVNHPDCPLFRFDTDDKPTTARRPDDNPMTMRF